MRRTSTVTAPKTPRAVKKPFVADFNVEEEENRQSAVTKITTRTKRASVTPKTPRKREPAPSPTGPVTVRFQDFKDAQDRKIKERRHSQQAAPPPSPGRERTVSKVTKQSREPARIATAQDGEGKENIQVVVRFRPSNEREKGCGRSWKWDGDEEGGGAFRIRKLGTEKKLYQRFDFDRVIGGTATQRAVFTDVCLPLVERFCKGYNCCLLAYGQTGSGKTYTVMGGGGEGVRTIDADEEYDSDLTSMYADDDYAEDGNIDARVDPMGDDGMVQRIVTHVFDHIRENSELSVFSLNASFMEIYMEQINDLIDADRMNLRIRQRAEEVYVENISSLAVTVEEEIMRAIQLGIRNRKTARTDMNSRSSRSHAVLQLHLTQTCAETGVQRRSKMFVVDLAGSEQVERSGVTGTGLREAVHVNKSLSALSLVIHKLAAGDTGHIPYRDSVLTRLLTECLGGNSSTTVMLHCSPSMDSLQETHSTLSFGLRAKTIKTAPRITDHMTITGYRRLVEDLRNQLQRMTLERDSLIRRINDSDGLGTTAPQFQHIPQVEDEEEVEDVEDKETKAPDAESHPVKNENRQRPTFQTARLYKTTLDDIVAITPRTSLPTGANVLRVGDSVFRFAPSAYHHQSKHQ